MGVHKSLATTYSIAVRGLEGVVVEIEAFISSGLPTMCLVGLPDTALQEARDRVRAAIVNSGHSFPQQRVTLALSPATLPKMGSVYDVPMAVSILLADTAFESDRNQDFSTVAMLGELALDGRVRSVNGILPAVLAARNHGFTTVMVPTGNLGEASLVDGLTVLGVTHLQDVMAYLRGDAAGLTQSVGPTITDEVPVSLDLADVIGQDQARFALEVAAAGGHHLFLAGPPGIGKTMLAQRLPGILPRLSMEESLEVSAIASVAGALSDDAPLVTHPPFIAPHHTTTVTALIGGGTGMAKPGAVSRAHRGVLFLDECAEMGSKALESLRTPLEEGQVRLARRDGVATYPARFQLVMAANPCPCAASRDCECRCQPTARRRYLGRLSGPLMDRIDLRVTLAPLGNGTFTHEPGEASAIVRARVTKARRASEKRWQDYGFRTNSEVPGPILRREFNLPRDVVEPLERCLRDGRITARGADRALRVAWTLSDLNAQEQPTADDVMTALMFRERSFG